MVPWYSRFFFELLGTAAAERLSHDRIESSCPNAYNDPVPSSFIPDHPSMHNYQGACFSPVVVSFSAESCVCRSSKRTMLCDPRGPYMETCSILLCNTLIQKIFFQVEVFQLYHLKAWAMISTMSYHVQMQTIMILDLVPPLLITSAHMTTEVLYLFQSWNCFSFCTSCLA